MSVGQRMWAHSQNDRLAAIKQKYDPGGSS
jgi:hypothetical protein